MVTKQGCLTQFIRKYPGATSLVAIQQEFFDRAIRALLDKAEFRQNSVTLGSIVAGTYEYSWPEASLKAYQGSWFDSATSWWGLTLTSEANLRDLDPAWPASIRNGSPRKFYISARSSGLVIGFDQNPTVATVNGFPYALIQTEDNASLGLTDTIPPSLLDETPIVYRMCQYWAEEHDKGMMGEWERKAKEADITAVKHLREILPNLPEEQNLPPLSPFTTRII
jgi:hypothetical protein